MAIQSWNETKQIGAAASHFNDIHFGISSENVVIKSIQE